jgi:hypothetical protein
MTPIEEIENFTFEMIAKQDRLMSQAKEQRKSIQHIAEIYSKQEGMKTIYVEILKIKRREKGLW